MTLSLADLYRGYIDCLNTQALDDLGHFVADDVAYNGKIIGLDAYRQARRDEFRTIPDLQFAITILVANETTVASRLAFSISPLGMFLGLPVNGRRVSFSENVFYDYDGGKIARVWSVVDKAAIEAQLLPR